MEINQNKYEKWYLTRYHKYTDISDKFFNYGTLIIEGDSFVDYLITRQLLISSDEINKIIKKLIESGFEQIIITLFSRHSMLINKTNESIQLKPFLARIFNNVECRIQLFDDWNEDWSQFVADVHAVLFLTSEFDIFTQKDSKFEMIYKISNYNKIQIGLLDNMKFIGLKVYAFVFDRFCFFKDQFRNAIKNSGEEKLLNEKKLIFLENTQEPTELRDFFSKIDSSLNFFWEYKLKYRKEINFSEDIKKKQKQQFFRHYEKYSNSLEDVKNLHRSFALISNDSFNKSKDTKCSDIEEFFSLLEQNKYYKRIQCYDDLDECLKYRLINSEILSEKLKFRLLNLRINWLYYDFSDMQYKMKEQIYNYCKDLILNYHKLLANKKDHDIISKCFKCLKKLGFENTIKHLKSILKENEINYVDYDDNESNQDTFDHDIKFQLKYCGEHLEKNLNSVKDERVQFIPDNWQKDLLDYVDNNYSILVSCPTSSGKTFISYYIMDKILRKSDEDIVIFVVSEKSLANQVLAEVYARFKSKNYPKHVEKYLFSLTMPDEINHYTNLFKSQILIGHPFCIESMLCDRNNEKWREKIKYIIIDEIHTLNKSKIGKAIETIIHISQCPLLTMSATVGNLDEFYEWFKLVNQTKGIKTVKIEEKERFCDLKKYLFTNENNQKLIEMSDLFGYTINNFKNSEMSESFHLLPNEICQVIDTLEEISSSQRELSLVDSIRPKMFFKKVIINKRDVKEYGTFVVNNLIKWFKDDEAFCLKFFETINKSCNEAIENLNKDSNYGSREWSRDHLYDFLMELKSKNMLPVIFFLKSAEECNKLATELANKLEELETKNTNERKEEKSTRYLKNKKKVKSCQQSTRNLSDKLDDAIEDCKINNLDYSKIKSKKNREKDENMHKNSSNETSEDEDNLYVPNAEYTFFDNKFKLPDHEAEEEIRKVKHFKNKKKYSNGGNEVLEFIMLDFIPSIVVLLNTYLE